MNFKEIVAFLTEREMADVIKSLLDAVESEASALAKFRQRLYDPAMTTEAEDLYAADITRAMEEDDYLNPHHVLSHRERYMTAWAVAQIIKKKQAEEDGTDEEADATDVFVKLAQANADLGVKTVDLLLKLDEKEDRLEELRAELETSRKAGDAAKLLAHNLCWMADTVHKAHHHDPYNLDPYVASPLGPTPCSSWKNCEKGTCGSMEHMLALAGFDKDLNVIPRRP